MKEPRPSWNVCGLWKKVHRYERQSWTCLVLLSDECYLYDSFTSLLNGLWLERWCLSRNYMPLKLVNLCWRWMRDQIVHERARWVLPFPKRTTLIKVPKKAVLFCWRMNFVVSGSYHPVVFQNPLQKTWLHHIRFYTIQIFFDALSDHFKTFSPFVIVIYST